MTFLATAWSWLAGSALGRALAAILLAVGAVKAAHVIGRREGRIEAEGDVEERYRRAVNDTVERRREVDDQVARMTDEQVDEGLRRWVKK